MPKRQPKLKLKNLTSCLIQSGGIVWEEIRPPRLRREWPNSWWGLLARKAAAALEVQDPGIWTEEKPTEVVLEVVYRPSIPVTDVYSLIAVMTPVPELIRIRFVNAVGVQIAECTAVC